MVIFGNRYRVNYCRLFISYVSCSLGVGVAEHCLMKMAGRQCSASVADYSVFTVFYKILSKLPESFIYDIKGM